MDDLYGTLHSPGDGTIDPASWATSLTRAAVKNGAQVLNNTVKNLSRQEHLTV